MLTHWVLMDFHQFWKWDFRIYLFNENTAFSYWRYVVLALSTTNQYWTRQWLGAARLQVINWTNFDLPVLRYYMMSPAGNEFRVQILPLKFRAHRKKRWTLNRGPFHEQIEAETKWTPFRRRHLQMHFLEWKCLISDWNFTEVCS